MTVQKFITKPFEIEAVHFDGTNFDEVYAWTSGGFQLPQQPEHETTDITAEVWNFIHRSWVGVKDGQWIVKGNKGEYYPEDDETLHSKYEAVKAGDEDLDDALAVINAAIASIRADAVETRLYEKGRISTLEDKAAELEQTRGRHDDVVLTESQQDAVDTAQEIVEESEGGTVPKEDFERNWKAGQ